ncbi:hypothetical protein KKF64_02235 [Patescibacteria group bacterium]|nr:hypothetical protein [Patescibacteria group bacterium]
MKPLFLIMLIILLFPAQSQSACNFHNVSGYVWSRTYGWISLNCASGGTVDYGLDIDFESGAPTVDVTGYAWSSNLGWLNFDAVGPYPSYGSAQYDATFFRNQGGSATTTAGVIKGWAKWNVLGNNGWMTLGPIEIDSIDYGVEIGADRLFSGWSWNGGDNLDADPEPERGDGWVMWDSVDSGGGASVLAYWFETLYGSFYSGGNVDAPFAPPLNRYNATYLIQANGTIKPVALQSASGSTSPYISESHDSFALPDATNQYRGTLGWLDKAGLLAGRYGALTEYSSTKTSNSIGKNVTLGGKVYRYTGNVSVDKAITFKKGGPGVKGSGTIIVDGDLTIEEDILYQTGAVSGRVENLASVAWIVLGDIIIDADVQNIVGLFYSEGSISTGTKGTAFRNFEVPIKIEGMLIAGQINLQRLFADETQEPAEQIIFDGRAIINPSPGLADIGKGLPILREIRP